MTYNVLMGMLNPTNSTPAYTSLVSVRHRVSYVTVLHITKNGIGEMLVFGIDLQQWRGFTLCNIMLSEFVVIPVFCCAGWQ